MCQDKVGIPPFALNRGVLTGVLSAGSLFLVTPVPKSGLAPLHCLKAAIRPWNFMAKIIETVIPLLKDLYLKLRVTE